jgi:DNA-binding HxlR family transcriptional regulator
MPSEAIFRDPGRAPSAYPSLVAKDVTERTEGAHTVTRCDAALSHAFGILGKRWNGMILGSLIEAPGGFAELRRGLGGISDSVLSDRLSELTAAGVVLREVDPGPPVAVRYRLTEAGEALAPVLNDLMTWAREHL